MLRRVFSAALLTLAVVLACPGLVHAAEDPMANGVFLVAKPELLDPNFRETVVLITQPVAGGGPLGVILNRPSGARLSEAWPAAGAVPEQFDELYRGGPVAPNQVIFLMRSRERVANGLHVLDDVYLSGDPDLLKKIVEAEVKVRSLRAYAGYAGWAPRQLQAEITAGGWYLIPAEADMIFMSNVDTMWATLIRNITLRSTRLFPHEQDGQSIAGGSSADKRANLSRH